MDNFFGTEIHVSSLWIYNINFNNNRRMKNSWNEILIFHARNNVINKYNVIIFLINYTDLFYGWYKVRISIRGKNLEFIYFIFWFTCLLIQNEIDIIYTLCFIARCNLSNKILKIVSKWIYIPMYISFVCFISREV